MNSRVIYRTCLRLWVLTTAVSHTEGPYTGALLYRPLGPAETTREPKAGVIHCRAACAAVLNPLVLRGYGFI